MKRRSQSSYPVVSHPESSIPIPVDNDIIIREELINLGPASLLNVYWDTTTLL